MGKATFQVKVKRKGREDDYDAFWLRNKQVNDAGEDLHSDLVGFVVPVEANNIKEAVRLVQAKFPGHVVDVGATQRLA